MTQGARQSRPQQSIQCNMYHNHRSTSSTRMLSSLSLLLVLVAMAISGAQAQRIVIEPNPNQEVGMMSSESRYFNCKLQNGGSDNDGQQLKWFGPNGEIGTDNTASVYTVQSKRKVKLEIKSPTKADSGKYRCVLNRPGARPGQQQQQQQKQSQQEFTLKVYNPTTVTGLTNMMIKEDDRLAIDCAATADHDAQVEFTWMFGNEDLTQKLEQYKQQAQQQQHQQHQQRGHSGQRGTNQMAKYLEPLRYEITQHREDRSSQGEIRHTSTLVVRRASKEDDGKYVCQVETSNSYLSDEKELRTVVRVQYRPRFDEKIPSNIWISEEAVQQGGGGAPIAVNISCIVYADPVAKLKWTGNRGEPIAHEEFSRGGYNRPVRHSVVINENMSILTVHYKSLDVLKSAMSNANGRPLYTCFAENSQGINKKEFHIKIGRIPDSPQILNIDYTAEGTIVLTLNESHVEPPIDIYRLEIGNERLAHLFNKSSSGQVPQHGSVHSSHINRQHQQHQQQQATNQTYTIELTDTDGRRRLSKGEHKVAIFAHNPVGWSEQAYSSYLTVINGATRGSTLSLAAASVLTVLAIAFGARF